MTNEPKMAPNAPASDPAKQPTTPEQAKPDVITTPAPVVAPIETKKI